MAKSRAVCGSKLNHIDVGRPAVVTRTRILIYFSDPASVLRQYFPKGTEPGIHSPEHLATVADEFVQRPLEILGCLSAMEHPAV